MELRFDKCAIASFPRATLKKTANMNLDIDALIRELEPGETYKYLGVHECNGINHYAMKENITKEYYRRIRLELKTVVHS